MIISKTRYEDTLTYTHVLEIIETLIHAYERTGDTTFIPEIYRLNAWAEELKGKIQSKDYTEDDERERRVDELLNYENK